MAQQTYQGGALYELVARGVKDTYFYDDSPGGVNPFSWKYEKYPAVQTETRHVRPLNATGRGAGNASNRTILIDIDQYGDILQSASIHVRLPSWIPPQYQPYIKRGIIRAGTSKTDPAYGYTSAPAHALFSKIEILQDNITLQEVTGDALYVASRHEGSWNRHHYTDEIAGVYDATDPLAIQHSADPDITYIIPLPFIRDFPLVALRGQRFRVRLTLRDIRDIVVCSDPAVGRPAPWSVPTFTAWTSPTDISGTAFKPLGLAELDAPTVSIQLVQTYLSNDDRAALSKATYVIPYRRYITHNSYSVGPLTYSTYDAVPPTEPAIIRNYDGLYYVDRIYTVIRSERALQAGRRTVSGEHYINSLQSAYGSTVRDGPWGELVWNRLAQHAHETYASAAAIYIQNYGFGPNTLKTDATHTSYNAPGGLNYSEAVDPNLRLTLADIEADFNGVKGGKLDIILAATAFYAVENGRGGLLFGT
jgi:hypothetical protein